MRRAARCFGPICTTSNLLDRLGTVLIAKFFGFATERADSAVELLDSSHAHVVE
jgi:hypothetical protein